MAIVATPIDPQRLIARMNSIRNASEAHVADLHDEAERLTDWREHVRANPWVAMGAAVVGGYLVANRLFTRRNTTTAEQTAMGAALAPRDASSGLAGLCGSIAGAVVRQYALHAIRTHLGTMEHDRHATRSRGPRVD